MADGAGHWALELRGSCPGRPLWGCLGHCVAVCREPRELLCEGQMGTSTIWRLRSVKNCQGLLFQLQLPGTVALYSGCPERAGSSCSSPKGSDARVERGRSVTSAQPHHPQLIWVGYLHPTEIALKQSRL